VSAQGWMRSQVRSLKTELALGTEMGTADVCRALAAIANGVDWRQAVRR